MKCVEKSPVRKSPLKLGKETYGKKDVAEMFNQAFAPYFVSMPHRYVLNAAPPSSNKVNKVAMG